MKRSRAETILFRLNLIVIGLIFLFLAPTTHVFSRWLPDQDNALWLIPVLLAGLSAFIWFLMRLSIPLLIRLGIYEDQRKVPASRLMPAGERLMRMTVPMVSLLIQLLILTVLCAGLVSFLKKDSFDRFLTKLPYSQASMRRQMHS